MRHTNLSSHNAQPVWAQEFPVLGVPVRVECTDAAVGRVLGAALAVWRQLPPALRADAGVRLRVIVLDDQEGSADAASFAHRLVDVDRLFIQAPGSVGCADVGRGDGIALVARRLAGDAEMLLTGMIEPLTLFLVSALDRQPVHCAGLVRRGRLVLLAGPPGVGKSTMACAGLLRRWGVMAEDIVWVQQQPQFRVWGHTGAIKLPPEAIQHFPQLADHRLDIHPVSLGAESKVFVDVPLDLRPFPPVAHEGTLVLLERGPAARLEPVDRGALLSEMTAALQPGFDRFPDAVPAVVEGIGREGGWRLAMGPDPLEAVGLLEAVIDRASGATSPA